MKSPQTLIISMFAGFFYLLFVKKMRVKQYEKMQVIKNMQVIKQVTGLFFFPV